MKYFLMLSLVFISLSSCSVPPFDLATTLAKLAADKMALEAEVGTFGAYDLNEWNDYYFLPDHYPVFSGGVFVRVRDNEILGDFFVPDGDSRVKKLTNNLNVNTVYDQNSFSSSLHNIAFNNTNIAFMAGFRANQGAGFVVQANKFSSVLNNSYMNFNASTDFNVAVFGNPGVLPVGGVLGANQVNAGINDQYNLALFMVSSGNYYEGKYLITNVSAAATNSFSNNLMDDRDPAVTYSLTSAVLQFPSHPPKGFYQYDENNQISYFSYHNGGGSFTLYKWYYVTSWVFEELPNVKEKIVDVLSNGNILTVDGYTFCLYDSQGNLINRFKTGSMRFLFERQEDGVQKVFFSMPFDYEVKGEKGLSFRIYSVSTSDLGSL